MNPQTAPLKRAAVYARFSSDRQNERSCEDQTHLCRNLAEREGLVVINEYDDKAISGASTVNRIGLSRMLRDARAGRFDILICESLDRLSRDQADLATIRKELNFLGVGIVTIHDGLVGAMHIGLKGLMSEMFLADLAQRTRRGLSGRIRVGASAGGRSYGYVVNPAAKGALLIHQSEAAVVRRIFVDYLSGDNARTIASRLNAEAIAGPRGGKWNASTISGSASRQNGVLQNRLYAGEIVWNRQRFIKDPATGKRVSRLNPESEWEIAPTPELRIVPQELFDAVQARRAEQRQIHPAHQRRPKHLFSGLIKCACCGANYTITGHDRIGCAGFRERGDCKNNRTVSLKHIEQRVLVALRSQLAAPEVVEEFVRVYREERRKFAATQRDNRADFEKRHRDLTASIERLVDLIVAGNAPAALVERLRTMEAEKAQLEATQVPVCYANLKPSQASLGGACP